MVPSGVVARYIRLQKSGTNSGGNILNIAEVEVLGGPTIDTDGDGKYNYVDVDNDNDGILDTAELYCDQSIAPNGAFPTKIPASAGLSINAKQLLFFNWNGVVLGGSTTGETRSVTHNGVTYTAEITNFTGHTMSGSEVLTCPTGPNHMVGKFYSFTDTNFKPVLYSSSNSPNNSSASSFDFRITATKNGVELPVEIVIFDAEETGKQGSGQDEQLKFTVKSNGSNFSLFEQFGNGTIGSNNITGEGTGEITYINTKTSLNAMYSTAGYSPTIAVNATLKTSRQGAGFGVRLYCDTNNDGFPNYLDLDSDNDGCSDSNEYYNNTNTAVGQQLNQTSNTVAPTNADGSVNLSGVYPNPAPASAANVRIATTAKFTTSPVNKSVDENTVATFSAVATSTNTTEFTTVTGAPVYPTTANNNANINYSWEVSTDAGVNWTPVVALANLYSGVTSATLSVTASPALNNNEYRAVVKLNNQVCMNLKSEKAKLNVQCYAAPVIITEPGNTLDSAAGISSLGRAGVVSNWPMVRKSGWIVLESKSKGFVLNRVAFDATTGKPVKDGVAIITDPIEGMMVFDSTSNVLKVYTAKNGVWGWYSMEQQACRE